MRTNVLITCPPMLGAIERLRSRLADFEMDVVTPEVRQVLTEAELIALVPRFDGWIIGDDPATARVFETGKAGALRAAVKWGVGVDNVDLAACRRLGLPIANTPGMFGREVADIALGYVIALARQTFGIDRGVKAGQWPKPAGLSLADKTVALVGFGDVGRQTAKRLLAADMRVIAYDPQFAPGRGLEAVIEAEWPQRLEEADFLVFTCALTDRNRHLFNVSILPRCKPGLRIVNVARGPLIAEEALVLGLDSGRVHSAALDVFEVEPLPADSRLRHFAERCIFGSHNASNTIEAVERTSIRAIELLAGFLGLRHA